MKYLILSKLFQFLILNIENPSNINRRILIETVSIYIQMCVWIVGQVEGQGKNRFGPFDKTRKNYLKSNKSKWTCYSINPFLASSPIEEAIEEIGNSQK